MSKKTVRKVPHFLTPGDIEMLQKEAAALNKPTSWFCAKYNIVSSTFYKLTEHITRPGQTRHYREARQRNQALRNGGKSGPAVGRAKLVRPGVTLAENLADAAALALGDKVVATGYTGGFLPAAGRLDQARRYNLLSKVLLESATTLEQLEDVAAACNLVLHISFKPA